MWETIFVLISITSIYIGVKMFRKLCSYTPWGCYYRGPKPVYAIVVTNNMYKDYLVEMFRELTDDPVSIIVVQDEEVNTEYYTKTVNIVRALIESNRKKYHTILLLETSPEYADKFRENFRDVQVCEDVDAMIGDILDYDFGNV